MHQTGEWQAEWGQGQGLVVWSHRSGELEAGWGPAPGGGGADTLCDRSRMAALIGSRTPWRPSHVGAQWTAAWMVPNWVVMVSS